MKAKDLVRLERYWVKVDQLLSQLTDEQLQRLLDGMDLVWAHAWGLVNAQPILCSDFPNVPISFTNSRRRVHQVREKLRGLAQRCGEHSYPLDNLLKNIQLLGILARHELNVGGVLRQVLLDVDLDRTSLYQLLKACEFRSVSPDILASGHLTLTPGHFGRSSFMLVPAWHIGSIETEIQVQDMGGGVAGLGELIHFARRHSDLGDQSLLVIALGTSWTSRFTAGQVCAAMSYNFGERHLITIPVKDLNCCADNARILAWRKPGQ